MSQSQPQGLGGMTLKSTADLSGQLVNVTTGNPIGTTYLNAVGLFAAAGVAGYFAVAGAGVLPLGVILNTPTSDQPGQLQTVRGTTVKVLSGAAIAIGDMLMIDSAGRAITQTGSGARITVGMALETATAASQLIEAVLLDGYIAA